MSASAWVKWFSADFLNGISDLEPNEIAVYSVVLNLIYDGDGPIKDDAVKIGRRCNMRQSSAEKALSTLADAGKITRSNGSISNARCEKEIESRKKVVEKSAESANARWKKQAEKPNEINKTAMRTQCDGICETDAIQIPEPDKKELDTSYLCKPDENSLALLEYNRIAKSSGLPQAQKLTASRKASLKSRIADAGGLPGFIAAIERAARSSFLTGANKDGWKAGFDFFMQQSSFLKLIEGNYDNKRPSDQTAGANFRGSAADQIIAGTHRRLALHAVDGRPLSERGADYCRDEEVDDWSSGPLVINNEGQKAASGGHDSGFPSLSFPSADQFGRGH